MQPEIDLANREGLKCKRLQRLVKATLGSMNARRRFMAYWVADGLATVKVFGVPRPLKISPCKQHLSKDRDWNEHRAWIYRSCLSTSVDPGDMNDRHWIG